MLTPKRYKLGRSKMLAYLDFLDATDEPAITLHLAPNTSREELSAYLERTPVGADCAAELGREIAVARTGSVLFWGETQKRLVVPPFPRGERYLTDGYDTAPLRAMLMCDYRIGIVLVRLGSFSLGICEGDRLVEHKTGTGLVHGRQRQGGSSSARFQRRREEQAHHFLERVAAHVEEKFAPYAKKLDFVVYGGARTTIEELRKVSTFLRQFDDRLLPPLLTIPEPRYEVLEQAVSDVWSSRVTEWRVELQEFT